MLSLLVVYTVDLSGLMANNEEQMVLSSLSPAPLLDYTTFVDLNDECKCFNVAILR